MPIGTDVFFRNFVSKTCRDIIDDVDFNDVTKDSTFYTTTSRFVVWFGAFSQERQVLWLPKDDLRDPSSWSSSPLLLLRDIHSKLLVDYNCKEVSSQSQVNVGVSGRLSLVLETTHSGSKKVGERV